MKVPTLSNWQVTVEYWKQRLRDSHVSMIRLIEMLDMISGSAKQEPTRALLPGVGSIINPTSGTSLTRGVQRVHYC